MDTRLRELERQAITDPEARKRWVEAMKQTGHLERMEHLHTLDVKRCQYELGKFQFIIADAIAKSRQRSLHKDKNFHRFEIAFTAERESCCGHYDCFCDTDDIDQHINIIGFRFETEQEKQTRIRQERQETERQHAMVSQKRAAIQRAKRQKEDQEMAIYLRVKERVETEQKTNALLQAIGPEAREKLTQYSSRYYKSWFNRKSKKLGDRSPLQVFEAQEIDLLRRYALKQL